LPRAPEAHSFELALFAVACWAGQATPSTNCPSTVLSKCSHVAWHRRLRYGYGVGISDGHRLALLGMRRLTPAPSCRAPVTTAMGYCFLLRRSEYLSVNGKLEWFIIQRRDVVLSTKQGQVCSENDEAYQVTINFRGSKTGQFGKSTSLSLTKSSIKWLCPVRAAVALLREGSKLPADSPLCSVDGLAIAARAMDRVIKQAAAHAGEDSIRYGTHSLRSGGATALFEAGCTDSTIKLQGRWFSDCFQRYIRMETTTMERLSDMVAHAATRDRRPKVCLRGGGSLSSP
jgi:hypothetical protein